MQNSHLKLCIPFSLMFAQCFIWTASKRIIHEDKLSKTCCVVYNYERFDSSSEIAVYVNTNQIKQQKKSDYTLICRENLLSHYILQQ